MNLIISKKPVCLVVLIASVALSIVTVSAADGDPDAKQELRDIAKDTSPLESPGDFLKKARERLLGRDKTDTGT